MPLKGTLSGQVQFLPTEDCPIGLATTVQDASVITSHLGRTIMFSRHCTPTGEDFGPGEMILVAAHGDERYTTYTGTAPYPEPGVEGFEDRSWPATWTMAGTITY